MRQRDSILRGVGAVTDRAAAVRGAAGMGPVDRWKRRRSTPWRPINLGWDGDRQKKEMQRRDDELPEIASEFEANRLARSGCSVIARREAAYGGRHFRIARNRGQAVRRMAVGQRRGTCGLLLRVRLRRTRHDRPQGLRPYTCVTASSNAYAMALSYRASRSTYDLDALIISDREPVLDAARRVAIRRSWSPNWLNDEAARLIPKLPDHDAVVLFDSQNLTVTGASPEFLLAMKMRSARESDFRDIATLLDALDIQTSDQALAVHDEVFPRMPLADVERTGLRLIIAELISARQDDR